MVDGGGDDNGDDDGHPLAFCHQLSLMTKCNRSQFDADERVSVPRELVIVLQA